MRRHACFLVEMPTPEGAARGPRILFDPVLSHRCSPISWLGPGRLLRESAFYRECKYDQKP